MPLIININGEVVEPDEFGLASAFFAEQNLAKRIAKLQATLNEWDKQLEILDEKVKDKPVWKLLDFSHKKFTANRFRKFEHDHKGKEINQMTIGGVGMQRMFQASNVFTVKALIAASIDLKAVESIRDKSNKISDPIKRWTFITEAKPVEPLQYFDELEWQQAMKSIMAENPKSKELPLPISAPSVKLKWNGQAKTLYYLLMKLKTLEQTKDGLPFIEGSNEELALFIANNFEGMPKISTIRGALGKVLQNPPMKSKAREIDRIVEEVTQNDLYLPE